MKKLIIATSLIIGSIAFYSFAQSSIDCCKDQKECCVEGAACCEEQKDCCVKDECCEE